jgi:hypothetical protein
MEKGTVKLKGKFNIQNFQKPTAFAKASAPREAGGNEFFDVIRSFDYGRNKIR